MPEFDEKGSVQFNENKSIRSFRDLIQEHKNEFLSKILKNDQNIECYTVNCHLESENTICWLKPTKILLFPQKLTSLTLDRRKYSSKS